jgi:hypothetical protein
MRNGRCLCGAVRFTLEGELPPLINCHCQYCRRAHGAAFATLAWIPSAALRVVQGADAVRDYRTAGVGSRAFCGRCGTRLWNRAESMPAFLSLAIASLEEQPERGPVMHINVESKARWYEILDGLPQHTGPPPGVKRAIEQ